MVKLGNYLGELESTDHLKPGHFYVQDVRPEGVFIVFLISNTDKKFASIEAEGKIIGDAVKVFNENPQLVYTWILNSYLFTVSADFELGVWYEAENDFILQKRLIKDLFEDRVDLENGKN